MKNAALKYLRNDYLQNISLIESLRTDNAEILYADTDGVIIKDKRSGNYMMSLKEITPAIRLVKGLSGDFEVFCCSEQTASAIKKELNFNGFCSAYQFAYLKEKRFDISSSLTIKAPNPEDLSIVKSVYKLASDEEIEKTYRLGHIFMGYENGEPVGFSGIHLDGSMGMLEILHEHRRKGYGEIIEKYMINYQLDNGFIPFCHVICDNLASVKLQNKLGLVKSSEKVFWIFND